MKAVKCPVCDKTGKVNGKPCHGCGGRGWVEVKEDETPYIPYVPYPTYPWYPDQPYLPWYYDHWTITYKY